MERSSGSTMSRLKWQISVSKIEFEDDLTRRRVWRRERARHVRIMRFWLLIFTIVMSMMSGSILAIGAIRSSKPQPHVETK